MRTSARTDVNLPKPKAFAAARSTVASQVYKSLYESIISLRLAPGASMSELEMAASLGVSRTPVREAFIRLSREGLIVIYPQRGTVVSRISLKRAFQERFLRESLERSVLETFAHDPPQSALAAMQRQIDLQRASLLRQDIDAYLISDDRFHFIMYEETGNDLCSSVIRRNCHDYQRLRVLSAQVSREVQQLNVEQHEQLLELIRQGGVEEAQALLRVHLRRLFKEMDALRASHPDYIDE